MSQKLVGLYLARPHRPNIKACLRLLEPEHLQRLATYYSDVRPTYDYLKEVLVRVPRDELSSRLLLDRQPLDGVFIHESWDFMKLALVNFMAYKYLMGGGYSSWGNVTLYYSNFYAANCLLRLAGKAVVHVTWISADSLLSPHTKPDRLDLILERASDGSTYHRKNLRGAEHQVVFNLFSQAFPGMLPKHTGDYIRGERVRENYDLLYPSQEASAHALDRARDMYQHDFADPDYDKNWPGEAQEYLGNIYSSYGWKEAYSAEWLRTCIDTITAIGQRSNHRPSYRLYFQQLMVELPKVQTKTSTASIVFSWIQEALRKLQ